MAQWNPWHGCKKISPGCQNCYVYRTDSRFDKDSSKVVKNSSFTLPVQRDRNGRYKLSGGQTVYTCFTSDFFLDSADKWRIDAWNYIRNRPDLFFIIITKRIDRFEVNLPSDWQDGYQNVRVCCTVENQDRADYRLPIFLKVPVRHKSIVCEPLLERIDISKYLTSQIDEVIAGGESGNNARICDYDWIYAIREQCVNQNVNFIFKQTGARFYKDGKIYRIARRFQHAQAKKANIDYIIKKDA